MFIVLSDSFSGFRVILLSTSIKTSRYSCPFLISAALKIGFKDIRDMKSNALTNALYLIDMLIIAI